MFKERQPSINNLSLIEKIMTQNENENNENINDNNIIKNKDINNDNKPNSLLLSSIYDLFDGYDEIIIKPNQDNQYIIEASINLEENAQIKFKIIYDNESKKFDELINIFEDYEESWSENVEKDMFNELAINNDWYSDPS